MIQELILSIIVSIDIFLAAAAYRTENIRIPVSSALIINIIGAVSVGSSLWLSELAGHLISPEKLDIFGFMILTAIGISTIFKSLIRTLVRRLSERGELALHSGSTGIVVKLYLDDTAADIDCSKVLSPKEAAALALAVSVDCVATGLSVGYNGIDPLTAAVFTFFSGISAIAAGILTGRKIASLKHDLSWLGGVGLIAFAIFEVFI